LPEVETVERPLSIGMLSPAVVVLLLSAPSPQARQFEPSPARDADYVPSLPMWGAPPTDTYSGFLRADAVEPGTRLHYHFIASSAAGDPTSIPVVLWTNGGPGSSSYLGLLQELGPLLINATGGLFANPYAWTTEAHLLVLESPAGVGYSYCAAQRAGGSCANTDTSTARAARAAVVDFYTRLFPELRKSDLWLTGESYSGVYTPTLARELLEHAERIVPLAGLAVGDPCTDNTCQADSMDMVWYSHKYGLLPDRLFDTLWHGCRLRMPARLSAGRWGAAAAKAGAESTLRVTATGSASAPSAECRVAARKFLAITSRGFSQSWGRAYLNDLSLYGPSATTAFDAPGSLDAQTAAWMNRADVRAALHVVESPAKAWPGPGDGWSYSSEYSACNAQAEPGTPSMIEVYREIAPRLKRTLVFNGDTDPCVSYEGTREAIRRVGFAELSGGGYRPWFFNASAASVALLLEKPTLFGPSLSAWGSGPQIGGSVVEYEHGLAFATVHGSGHMVPQFRPRAALHMLSKLIRLEPLAPRLPTDRELEEMSDDEFGASVDKWTDRARAAPFAAL
jgi:cathepsin A (carboxypeptidase C)